MPKYTPGHVNFNAGELSPLIDTRADLEKYASGCQILENAFPLVEGPAKKMPGTFFVANTKYSDRPSILLPFSFSTIQDYLIEFGDLYMRFFMNEGQIIIDPSETDDFNTGVIYPVGVYTKLGPYGTYTWAGGKQINISFPYLATHPNISITLNSSNALSVTAAGGTLHINLANGITNVGGHDTQGPGTANSADLIEAAINALGYVGGVDFSKVIVTANAAYTSALPVTAPSASAFSNTNFMYQCIKKVDVEAGSGYASWASGQVLTISYAAPVWTQIPGTTGPPILVEANTEDYLNAMLVPNSMGQYVTIQLADATPAKNSSINIQTVVNGLGVRDGAAYWNISILGNTAYDANPPTTSPDNYSWNGNTSIFPTDTGYWKKVNIGDPVEISTPYAVADIYDVDNKTQSADVLYFCHNKYPMMRLIRHSHINWELTTMNITGTIDIATTGTSGIAKVISNADTHGDPHSNPCNLRVDKHGFNLGDRVYINGVVGPTTMNESVFTIVQIYDENHCSINLDEDSDEQGYESGGTIVRVDSLFEGAGDYPACCCLYEQRLMIAGFQNNPLRFQGSVQGDFQNFISDPSLDDYAVQYDIVSGSVDAIRWMVSQQQLMLGTAGGVFRATGSGTDSPLSQHSIDVKKEVFTGVGNIHPIMASDDIIWITRSATVVRLLVYDWAKDKWLSPDLTRMARHITIGSNEAGSGVTQATFQKEPYPILWLTRTDGQLLGMVFEMQEEINGWFRLVTQGKIVSAACVSQDNAEDQLWQIVNRTINGNSAYCVEYYAPQQLYHDIKNSFFVHCGASWVGNPPVSITSITRANPAHVVAPGHGLLNGQHVQITGAVGMTQANMVDNTRAFTVANATQNEFDLYMTDSRTWGVYAGGGTVNNVQRIVSGLSYLMGETVSGNIDGAAVTPFVVTADTQDLGFFGHVVNIGLPYISTIIPMKLHHLSRQGTSRGKKQKMSRVTLCFYETVGCKCGPNQDSLEPILEEIPMGMATQPAMFTGDVQYDFPGDWDDTTDLVIVHDQPLPFTITGFVPRFNFDEELA